MTGRILRSHSKVNFGEVIKSEKIVDTKDYAIKQRKRKNPFETKPKHDPDMNIEGAAKSVKTELHLTVATEVSPKSKKSKKISKTVQPIKSEDELVSPFKRNQLLTKFVGAHTSVGGGLENSVYDAAKMGASAFALFVRSHRKWNSKPLEDKTVEKFKSACKEHGFPPHLILPHGSYLLNCGAPNEETLKKSRDALVDELQRCEKLGLTLYNFHPGSTCGLISVDECIQKIAESINLAHSKTKYIITVIENMCGQGNTIGGKFEELRAIIDQVKDKSRVGVCIDTCHAFAAGYDLASEAGYTTMMDDFETKIGFKYLKGLHFNDSKGKVGCHLDRHENIGKGQIGLEGFKRFMNDSRLDNIPIILETPWISDDINAKEIKMLYSQIDE